jgi:hypothetical protein
VLRRRSCGVWRHRPTRSSSALVTQRAFRAQARFFHRTTDLKEEQTMAKRAKTARKRNTSAQAKGEKSVPALPVVARAAAAIPVTAIVLAVGACAVGALAFMMLAGASGQRRRELIREKAQQAGETLSKTGREVRQRLESVAMEASKRVRGERSEGTANGVSEQRMRERALNI